MAAAFKFGAYFLGLLLIAGGTVFPTKIGKIEVGSIDPWAWLFAVLLFVAYRFKRDSFEQFLGKSERALSWSFDPLRAKRRVAFLIAAVFGLVFVAHQFRHWNFDTHLYDMGFVNQGLFYPYVDGTFLQADLSPKRSYLVDHFSPTLLLLTPLTAWIHSNTLVFALQQLLLGLGAFLLLTQGPLKKAPSLLLSAAFVLLANRSLRNGGLWDFREDAVAFFFLSSTIVALYSRKWILYFLFLAGFVLSKEHLGIVGLGIVAPLLFDKNLPYSRNERIPLAGITCVLLLAWSAAVFGFITPALQKGIAEANNITMRFAQFGDSPKAIILHVLTSPSAWWFLIKTKLLTAIAWKYALLMLLPYLFFARRSWSWIAAAGIGLASNMASDSSLQRSLNFHYDLAFLPFLMTGVLVGMKNRFATEKGLERRELRLLLLGLFIALAFSGRWPAFHIWRNFPSFSSIQDHAFLENLSCPGTIAASQRNVARLVHCREIRAFELPASCENPLTELLRLPDDTSRISGQSARNASEFVFDRERACEGAAALALAQTPGALATESPSKRFVYIRLPEALQPLAL